MRGKNNCADTLLPKMPSSTEIAQQFDSIEDSIAAFSEYLPPWRIIHTITPLFLLVGPPMNSPTDP